MLVQVWSVLVFQLVLNLAETFVAIFIGTNIFLFHPTVSIIICLNVLLVEFEPCIFLGPRALNLWAKPKMVLWLRRKGSSLVCEGHVLGAAAADNHPVLVSALDMKARLTASEAPPTRTSKAAADTPLAL